MKKLFIYAIIFLSLTTPCFASWRDIRKENIDFNKMKKKERAEFLRSLEGQFFIPPHEEEGVIIAAATCSSKYKDPLNIAALRYIEEKVDVEIVTFKSLNDAPSALYLVLLDDYRRVVKSVFMSDVKKDFKGELSAKFEMPWSTFQTIKYYELVFKVAPTG